MIDDCVSTDQPMLRYAGIVQIAPTPDEQGVALTVDVRPLLTEFLGRLAVEIGPHVPEFIDRLEELAFLHSRVTGLSQGSLDPAVEECTESEAVELRDAALNELLVAFDLKDLTFYTLSMRGMVAPTVAHRLIEATSLPVALAYERLVQARSAND